MVAELRLMWGMAKYWAMPYNLRGARMISMITCLFMMSAGFCADEADSRAVVMASFLPAGSYESIEYADIGPVLRETPAFKYFESTHGTRFRERIAQLPLPPSITEFCTGFLRAVAVNYVPQEAGAENPKPSDTSGASQNRNIVINYTTSRGKTAQVTFHHDERPIWILSIPDVVDAIRNAVKRGDLVPLAEKRFGGVFYSFTDRSGSLWYTWSDEYDLLIVCEEITRLRTAIDAGMNAAPALLDDDELNGFRSLIPGLGQFWIKRDDTMRLRAQLHESERYGASESHLETLRTAISNQAQFNIMSITFDKDIRQSIIMVFVDEDAAKEALKREQSRLDQGAGLVEKQGAKKLPYAAQYHEKTAVMRDGMIVTVTTIQDEGFLKSSIKQDKLDEEANASKKTTRPRR